jgi:tRNA-specific 2-thiouridylase
VDAEGNVIGEHDGIHGFTIGQRKRIPTVNNTTRPLYVTEINADSGRITVGHAENLMNSRLYASGVNWISGSPPSGRLKVEARIRYNGKNTPARVRAIGNAAEIEFAQPVRAITPGQAVVFYADSVVIGGGLIETSLPTPSAPEPFPNDTTELLESPAIGV